MTTMYKDLNQWAKDFRKVHPEVPMPEGWYKERASRHDDNRDTIIQSAYDMSQELCELINEFLDGDLDDAKERLANFLWNNKLDILLVLEAHAKL